MRNLSWVEYTSIIKTYENSNKELITSALKSEIDYSKTNHPYISDNQIQAAITQIKSIGSIIINGIQYYGTFEKVTVQYPADEYFKEKSGKEVEDELFKIITDNPLNNVLTASEASEKWGLSESTIRKAVNNGKFLMNSEYRKSKGTILILLSAMKRIYGECKEENTIMDWKYVTAEEDKDILVYKVINIDGSFEDEKSFITKVVSISSNLSDIFIMPDPENKSVQTINNGIILPNFIKSILNRNGTKTDLLGINKLGINFYVATHKDNENKIFKAFETINLNLLYVDTYDKFKEKMRNLNT